MSHRIVVVEDSEALNELLCDALRKSGFEVQGFLDAESVTEYAQLKDTAVIVLDVQLPGESGLELAKRLRGLMPNLGILILTTRTSNTNRIEGYEAGADYYLPKPVSPDELVDAVNSLIRRKRQYVDVNPLTSERYLLSRTTQVLSCGSRSVKLSAGEAAILVALSTSLDKQLEHWQIMELLSTNTDQVSRSTLDVRIYRLRAKLSDFTQSEYPIVSIRGVGYRLGFELEVV
ncbi:response regulator transcription factor [Orrella daihaiensis]|uniref:Response regulator transcription factor n=1 Tax=Orrella daihaiensis TaxID=2782176 RepID=A0ABY4ALA5_9BURK|nr:response regulator transcription factor [Orrella daihaiensis]UOD49852.1 response regulator transcription factor [Orrella daihaiensis]